MQSFVLDRYGKTSRLRLADSPEPTVGDDDVLVEVHAAGVNVLDAKIRNGEFKPLLPYRLPVVLGHDVAGTVSRVGRNVRRFRPGDEVYARPRDFRIGTFATAIAIAEADVALKPRNLTMAEAASIPLVALTAWQVMVGRAKLQPGQKVFIQAGAGGVGTLAIQLAHHLGATVATTAGAASAPLLRQLGADTVIDYRTERFEDMLSGYDLVINSQDAATLEKSLRILKPGGLVVSISGPPDPAFARHRRLALPLRLATRFLSAGIRRKARQAGVRYQFLLMEASGSELQAITGLIETGALRPVLDRTYPFAQTNEALDYVDAGKAKGKVVITMR